MRISDWSSDVCSSDLASRVARDGDRDGLHNVLVEAQSQGLACLVTRVAAIPELVADGVTGVLVPTANPAALAAALARLLAEPGERRRLGAAGQPPDRPGFELKRGRHHLARVLDWGDGPGALPRGP